MKLLRLTLCLLLLTGCDANTTNSTNTTVTPEAEPARPRIVTVNYPLQWAAEQLAGSAAEVVLPVPAGQDPARWQPAADALADYRQADLVVLNGGGYAHWPAALDLPAARIVDTSARIRDQLLPTADTGQGARDGAGMTWLDPFLYSQQVQSLAGAIDALLPAQRALLDRRLVQLRGRTGKWNTSLHRIAKALGDTPVLYSRPLYHYLQQRYRLNGEALHWRPGQTPSAAQWGELDELLRRHPAKLMLWEDTPAPAVRAQLEQRGIAVVVYRPQANRTSQGDFGAVMDANIAAFNALVIDMQQSGELPLPP